MQRPQKAVIKDGDKYLVLFRCKNSKNFPEHWDFPGGKMDPGETREEALEREVREETSLSVKSKKIVGIYTMDFGDRVTEFTVHTTSNVSGKVKLSFEHTDFKWLTKEEVLELDKVEPYIFEYFKEFPNT